jgi:formylglycine-generating enzyme required for sulfatase activity
MVGGWLASWMVVVGGIGGLFHRSSDLAGDVESGGMTSPATISTFHLDRYEVTVGRFRAFVALVPVGSSPPRIGLQMLGGPDRLVRATPVRC